MFKKVESSRCLSCGDKGPPFEYKNILAHVEQSHLGAHLQIPYADRVADARTVRQVLNMALIVRYKLHVCLATEGGVQGVVRKQYVELRNDDDTIGLSSDSVGEHNYTATSSVLAFYARMHANLFVRELWWKGKSLGYGVALTAQPQQLVGLLHVMLSKVTPEKGRFARTVFREWEKLTDNPLAQRFMAGLTDEDIKELFVQPPM